MSQKSERVCVCVCFPCLSGWSVGGFNSFEKHESCKIHVPNHQPVIYIYTLSSNYILLYSRIFHLR